MQYLFGDYALDTRRCELRRAGRRIPLRPKVFDVLLYLISQRDRVVSRQEILEHLWLHQFVGESTLTSCIKEARQAVGDTGQGQRCIQTLHGRGYRFVAVVEEARERPAEGKTHARLAPSRASATGPTAFPNATPATSVLEDLGQVVAHVPVREAEAHVGAADRDTSPAVLDGERKQVTILCCALAEARGLAAQMGSEAMYRLMRAFLALAQRVVQRYEGTLMHRLSDGFVAFFGAPVAHEDHARRAVLAALELQQHARAEPALHAPLHGAFLSTSMGLHTGMVIIGPLEEDAQTLYATLDDTTDVAGRLLRLAGPGTILMSEATRRLVQEEVRVEAYDTLDSAELPRPLPVYRVQEVLVRQSGVPGRGGRLLSPFVGRTRELASLLALLAQGEGGHGQVVGIVGEPGIGKSRLLYEFVRTLRDMGVGYLAGHCLAYDRDTPYGPVRGILRQLCGMSDAEGPEAVAAKLRHSLCEAGLTPDMDAPYLLALLGIPEDTTALAGISPEVRRTRTLEILRHLSLHSPQGRLRVIAVENVHWIDPTSEEYLARLADSLSGAQLLLVTTYRPGYSPPWLDKSYATQLALPGLLPQDSRAVVQSVLPSAPDSGPWEQAILDTAAGNPFFLEELAWAVREGGVAQPTALIPDTVQAVLAARIDRLPPAEKRLLQTAAVIGHEVPLRLLQAVTELSEDVVQHGLARLQAGEFLYEARPFPDLAYTFKHALTHHVAYNSLLQERRCSLHARIVDALEELYADHLAEAASGGSPDQVERLAHHAWQGEVWEKAVTYLRQAGAKAIAGSANREAVAHFERTLVALQHLPTSRTTLEHAIDVRCDLRMALMPLNEPGRRLAILREAEALAQALDDQRRLGRVSIMIAHSLRAMGDLEHALASGHRVLDLATTRRDANLQVMAYFVLGEVYYGLGDYRRAITMLRRNVEALDHAGSQERFGEPTLGPGLQSVASRRWFIQALADVGVFAEGMAIAEDALRLAEADGHPYTLYLAYAGVSYLYLGKGEVHQAIPCLERSLELLRVGGIQQYRTMLYCALGWALALSDRIPDALALLERTVGQTPSASLTSLPLLNAFCWAGEVYIRAGHAADAHNLAVQALALARERKERGTEARTLRLLGDLAMHRDPTEAEQAENHYQQALALADELGMRPLQAHCHLGLGTLYGQIGRVEQARVELSMAIDLYRAMDMTFWLSQAEAALAQGGSAMTLGEGYSAAIG
jgi:DNA-binding winged helix-turn-helix (wHTH) protein/class 3 adenylate cyclase/tetratricopeptide (TPR) repeat protein